MVRSLYTRRIQSGRRTTHKKRAAALPKGEKEEGKNATKCVSIYYLVRRARIRAHLRVALVPGVVHADGSTARNRVVLFFCLLLSFVLPPFAAAAFSVRGRRHDDGESGVLCAGFISPFFSAQFKYKP